jgi:hypothetical protein
MHLRPPEMICDERRGWHVYSSFYVVAIVGQVFKVLMFKVKTLY